MPRRTARKKPEAKAEQIKSVIPRREPKNLVLHINNRTMGRFFRSSATQMKTVLAENVSRFVECGTLSMFQRRVTAISFHPKIPYMVAAGSKGGEIVIIPDCVEAYGKYELFSGCGPGGSITGMKFDEMSTSLYTTSLTGHVSVTFCGDPPPNTAHDLVQILFRVSSPGNWFTALELAHEQKMVMAGDCKGLLYLQSKNGEKVHKIKVHKKKINHIEVCPRKPHLIATASVDHTVKLWDFRMISEGDKAQPLHVLKHNKVVNSACFSPANSYSLLTTDQFDELRVYSTNLFQLQTTIKHPHRHFQYITPIKASWHPIDDIIVVGRFPQDKKEVRTIDLYNATNGKCLYQFQDSDTLISPLNYFNCTGDILISGSGHDLTVRRIEPVFEKIRRLQLHVVVTVGCR